jgi:hypothetical protein
MCTVKNTFLLPLLCTVKNSFLLPLYKLLCTVKNSFLLPSHKILRRIKKSNKPLYALIFILITELFFFVNISIAARYLARL